METYRLCLQNNHKQCHADHCIKRSILDDKARNCMYARGILDYLRDNNIPWERLGKDLAMMRETARWRMSDYPYLVEEYSPGMTELIEFKYWAQDIIAGRVEYFPEEQ